MDQVRLEHEVDANYEAFLACRDALMVDHADDHVLIRHQRMISFHASVSDALVAGRSAYSDGLYSVQEVRNRPIDLGFYSHAIDTRIA